MDGVVHPGHLLGGANRVLTANVVLPAWLHVESEVQHRRAIAVGEEVEIRARIAEVFERKGHQFVRLDVAWMAGGRNRRRRPSHRHLAAGGIMRLGIARRRPGLPV